MSCMSQFRLIYWLGILSRSVCPVILRSVLIFAVFVMLLVLLVSAVVSAAYVIIVLKINFKRNGSYKIPTTSEPCENDGGKTRR